MTTNHELITIAENCGIPLEGIYMRDELPEHIVYNQGYIINLEPATNEQGVANNGTHWCALIVVKNKSDDIIAFWFDPLGFAPPENINEFCNVPDQELAYSSKNIQGLRSVLCGYYCIAWLQYCLVSQYRSGDIYHDTERFLELFLDLDQHVDYQKNEFVLKTLFFS